MLVIQYILSSTHYDMAMHFELATQKSNFWYNEPVACRHAQYLKKKNQIVIIDY